MDIPLSEYTGGILLIMTDEHGFHMDVATSLIMVHSGLIEDAYRQNLDETLCFAAIMQQNLHNANSGGPTVGFLHDLKS